MEEKNLENKVEETKVDDNGATNDDVNKTPKQDNPPQETNPRNDNEGKSPDEIIAELRLDNAKLKRTNDKVMKEASNYKKQLRDKQSVEEIKAQEKAEEEARKDEEIKTLRRENRINKLKNSYLAQGYPEELAHKSAVALYDGDDDTLLDTQKERAEQIRNEVKAEFIANNPEINSGDGGEEEETDPFLDGFNSVD